MATVNLNKIVRIAVVDAAGNWGYVPWDGTASIQIHPGTGFGTIRHNANSYTISAADPAAAVTADSTSTTADAE